MNESDAVRILTEADWETLREIRLAALAQAPEAFGSTLEQEVAQTEAQWRQRITRRTFLVVTDGDRTLGLAGLAGLAGLSAPAGPGGAGRAGEGGSGVAELTSVFVRPEARGAGVGDRLLRAALRTVALAGHRGVRLWVAEGNAAAEGLYARHGFRRTGDVQPIGPGRGDEFAMARPVAADGGRVR